ncbi:cytochrome P450 [Legionella sp. D16C41]|uniref:cytochrome P450 n=1 Tax=Legionella sp. D16C41 TaxID=3402688 RepID=UPI003AF6A29E
MLQSLIHLKQFINRPIPFLHQQWLMQGDLASIQLGYKKLFVITEPNLTKAILTDDNYQKCRLIFDKIIPVTGRKGIVQLEGEAWEAVRKLTQPNFHRVALENYLQIFEKNITNLHLSKHQGSEVDCFGIMANYALGSIINIVLGIDYDTSAHNIARSFILLNQQCGKKLRTLFDWPTWIPTPTNRFINKTRGELISAIKNLSYTANPNHCPFYTSLTKLNSKSLLLDQLTTFLFAGFETTAASLAFTFYLLSKHQEVQAKVYQEVKQVLTGNPLITLGSLKSLKYTQAVYQESLRLYPPAWILAREVKKSTRLNGHNLKPGNIILINIRDLHRHPDYWSRPNMFYPERFITHSIDHKYVYIPFGMGKRICSGYQLTMIEAVYLIAKLIFDFQFELTECDSLKTQAMITQHPKSTIKLVINKR